jgi:hypothetical protein
MKPTRLHHFIISVLGMAFLSIAISGCATIESRKEERINSFNLLTTDQQNLVMQGRIAEGLSKDAVYIALGNPMRVLSEQINGVGTESWVYGRVETYSVPGPFFGPGYVYGPYGPRYYPGYYYDTTVSAVRDTFVVYFNRSGKVKGWREL